MNNPRFIHLRTHSAYSLLEGAVDLKRLIALAKAADMPAIAVTDTGNMFGALEFSEYAAKAGLQPIIGCQLALSYAPPARQGEAPPPARPIVLLAQNEGRKARLAICAPRGRQMPRTPWPSTLQRFTPAGFTLKSSATPMAMRRAWRAKRPANRG